MQTMRSAILAFTILVLAGCASQSANMQAPSMTTDTIKQGYIKRAAMAQIHRWTVVDNPQERSARVKTVAASVIEPFRSNI